MINATRKNTMTAILIALACLCLVTAVARVSVAMPSRDATEAVPGPTVIVRASYTDSPAQRVPALPRYAPQSTRSANITVHYNGSWDAAAQNAFEYAVSIWEFQIDSTEEIVVEAYWEDMNPLILGGGGATTIHRDFSGAPRSSTWYPVALANAIAGNDLNHGTAEIEAVFNHSFPSWYFGTDGLTPSNKWDFASVVLHELGHGLGFFGSMKVSAGIGTWGRNGLPFIYDVFAENGAGQSLINDFPNTSLALAGQLQSGSVVFDGAYANAANGGSRPQLYAPHPWSQGSSYSHLDEVFNGTPNALMTYSLDNGESIHDPGPVTRGMFQDMGWHITTVELSPDLSLTMEVVNGPDLVPGDPVSFALSIGNVGTGIASGVVITDLLPTDILTPTWAASPSLGGIWLHYGTTYVWEAEGLDAGASGTITVSGTIQPALPADFVIVNWASVSAANETNTDNNSAVVIVGGERAYLPLAIKTNQ